MSKHNYAIELAKYNKVFFLNPPQKASGINATRYANLWELDYRPFIMGLRFLPSFLQRYLIKRKFEELQKITLVEFDCVWSFDNSVFYDFTTLPKYVFTISHIVDYAQNFQFKQAASTANLCLGVSQNIVDRLKNYNKNSFLIPHGISSEENSHVIVTLPGSNRIKAMYAGNLNSQYLDKEVILKLIQENPNVDFVFLGKGDANWFKAVNSFFLGAVPHLDLLSYLRKADVLLMFYNVARFPKQLTNAHKILDYMRSGKVIVSNFVKDYEGNSHLLTMASNRLEIPLIFSKVISNLEFYNSYEIMAKRIAFASRNTYADRISEIENLIRGIVK